MVLAPFFGFVGDEFAAEFGAEDLLDERVGGEGFDCFVEGAGEFADAAGGELLGGEFVEVVFLRIAGVEFFADAFETCGENEGGGEVGVAAGIGVAAFAAATGHGDADGVGAVVAAVAVEDGRPGEVGHEATADEAFVGIDGGGEGGAEGGAVAEDAGDEVVGGLADAEAARVFGVGAFEEVVTTFQIEERHVEVRAAAGAVVEGFRHEGGEQAFLGGVVLGHEAEENEAVAHGEAVGVFEVELELRVRVFVVEGIEVPTEVIDGGGHFVQPGVAVEEALHVVAGLGEVVIGVGDFERAAGGVFDDVEFALDAEVEAEAHFSGSGELFFEGDAGADFVRLTVESVVSGEPGDFFVPGQDAAADEVGHGVDFVVVGALADAVEGVAGVEFGAGGEVLEVVDGDELAFGHAVDVDESADAVFDALGFVVVAKGWDIDGGCHIYWVKSMK